MDIRTKLVFALVGVSLASMAALGTLAYADSKTLLRTGLLRQLDALAASREQELENVVGGWSDRVRLIGSRTQLRLELAEFGRTGSETGRSRIARILGDAAVSVPVVRSLVVYGPGGQPVAASPAAADRRSSLEVEELAPGDDAPRFLGLQTESGVTHARYVMGLSLEPYGRVGWLEARLATDHLEEMARDTTGLGPTGETLVVGRAGDSYRILHATRHTEARETDPGHSTSDAVGGAAAERRVDPANLAVAGIDTMLQEVAVDYRGEPVWAATRYLDELGWGVVVKVDASQEAEPIDALRRRLSRGALAFASFGILAGILLGLHLARPIHDLAEVANRIRDGDTHVRAKIHHHDEIGMLAGTFNRMADALIGAAVELNLDDDADQESPPAPADEASP